MGNTIAQFDGSEKVRKTYVSFTDNGRVVEWQLGSGVERFALYVGVEYLYGGWMCETGGNPICLNMLEDENTDACDQLINDFNLLISSSDTWWEPLKADDFKYVADFLKLCGDKSVVYGEVDED